MPENDPGRDLRARSVKLIAYPLDFLMRRRSIVIFPWRSSPSACSRGGGGTSRCGTSSRSPVAGAADPVRGRGEPPLPGIMGYHWKESSEIGFTERRTMERQFKIIVEKHADGYVAYPLGLKGVVVGQGDTYEDALKDVKSAIRFHVETFGPDVLEPDGTKTPLTIPNHPTMKSSTLRTICTQTGIPREDFIRVLERS